MIEYFKSEKIMDHLTAIRSRSGEIMYLAEGTDRAVLIDTSVGIKGLAVFVKSLTPLPVTVLITHGHVDHAMGASEFSDVYMNPLDHDVYEEHRPLAFRKKYIAANLHAEEPWMADPSNFIQKELFSYKELKDGALFDLGQEQLEVYSLGGHTPGTMVVLLPKERILITGDACNTRTFLFDQHALSVEAYRENLLRIDKQLEGRYDRCFLMHHFMEASGGLLKNVIQICNDIMENKADDIEMNINGHTCWLAKSADENMRRIDRGEGNILYNKKKIRE